jgi:hypothetical protein
MVHVSTTANTAQRDDRLNERLPLGKALLDSLNPRRQLGELFFDGCKAVLGVGLCWPRAHERALTVPDHDQVLGLQLLESSAHRASGYAIATSNFIEAGQLVSRLVTPPCDRLAEQVRNLEVRRPAVVRIEFVHVNDGTAWVNTDRSYMKVLTLLYLSTNVADIAVAAGTADIKSPGGAATPAGARIETLGGSRNAG